MIGGFADIDRQVNYDHLLVVISARRGSIYDSSFEKLPAQLSKYFSNNSLIVLYPRPVKGEPRMPSLSLIQEMRRSITRR